MTSKLLGTSISSNSVGQEVTLVTNGLDTCHLQSALFHYATRLKFTYLSGALGPFSSALQHVDQQDW